MDEDNVENKNVKEWVAIRGECISGGEINEMCNLIAAAQGHAEVEVVQKKLVCGCILVIKTDSDEDIIL